MYDVYVLVRNRSTKVAERGTFRFAALQPAQDFAFAAQVAAEAAKQSFGYCIRPVESTHE